MEGQRFTIVTYIRPSVCELECFVGSNVLSSCELAVSVTSQLVLPFRWLTATEKSPSYAGAKMWNALPEDLKMTDRKHFRQTLKNWLLDRPFYSLNEFYGWRN
ncbi:hypothetical protein J6590_032766 [Homalodisca vitripennis]|nr:hypothetical protein J6590_032766 [Homalodisca vitripennis]